MKKTNLVIWAGLLAGWLTLIPSASVQSESGHLNGQIITNSKEIVVPTTTKGFVAKLRKQDRNQFVRDDEGKWTIYFVAFFSRPLPAEQIGIVVLDAKNEPVAVANVSGQKGQTTLSSQIVVDTTETPNKNHTLQVFYPKGKKPMILAKKQIILK